jgi:hypothetical protein
VNWEVGGVVQGEIEEEREISGAAMAGFTFAASMMVLVGAFQVTSGLAAVIDESDFEPVRRYAFDFDTTVWGWIHLLLGLAMVVAGFSLFAQRRWAGRFAIVLVGVSALNNFLFISHAPAWSLLVIALDVWIIWTLTRPGLLTR